MACALFAVTRGLNIGSSTDATGEVPMRAFLSRSSLHNAHGHKSRRYRNGEWLVCPSDQMTATPSPVETRTFTSVGFLRTSCGIGIHLILTETGPALARRTAAAGRNRVAVRAGLRMAQERADALVELGTDDVLEFAGVRVSFGIGDGECVSQQAFGETAAPHDIARAIFAVGREREFAAVQFEQFQIREARNNSHRVGTARLPDFLERRRDSLFAADPDLLEKMIEANLVLVRELRNLHDAPVRQIDATVG